MSSHSQILFADTSFYYASLDSRDSHHVKAVGFNRRIVENNFSLISSWEIIVETITLLRNRYSYDSAVNFINKILPHIEVIHIDDTLRSKALSSFKKLSSDKRLSLCDVISYILVKEYFKNVPCLAFDDDFVKLGLQVWD